MFYMDSLTKSLTNFTFLHYKNISACKENTKNVWLQARN